MPLSEPYTLSGRTGQMLLMPLAVIGAAALAAVPYAFAQVYSPIRGYISFVFVIWLALAAVTPMTFAGRILEVRNRTAMRAWGLATGVATVWLAWTCFAWLLMREATNLAPPLSWWLTSPGAVWAFAQGVAQEGWYSLHGLKPAGIVLWLSWIAEAAIVLVTCWRFAPRRIEGRGFCEDCDRWLRDEHDLQVSADAGATPREVRKAGLAAVTPVARPLPLAQRWLRICSQRCPECQRTAVYRVDQELRYPARNLLSPLLGVGEARDAEQVIPLSWQRDAERAELQRISAELAQQA